MITKKEILGYNPTSKLFPIPKTHKMKRLTPAETIERISKFLSSKGMLYVPSEADLSHDFIYCYGDAKSFVVMIKKEGYSVKTGEKFTAGYIQYIHGDDFLCAGVAAKESNVDIIYFTGDKFLVHSTGDIKINIHVINDEVKCFSPGDVALLLP